MGPLSERYVVEVGFLLRPQMAFLSRLNNAHRKRFENGIPGVPHLAAV